MCLFHILRERETRPWEAHILHLIKTISINQEQENKNNI
ncbi:hypothetical protein COO91_01167 [Nostoc flagelliforme CCNUN1]|uniref:Uncharacterized protein n=1 Tax=Nostoc flagelliforme CCNUN1 TaxID=2038116 RepID=A0A2K8SIM0_9NOSO|nr:hypothetical protein COO91_01167 [Nostoc flagelliforme CCNUN1]